MIDHGINGFLAKNKNGYLGTQSNAGCYSFGVTKLMTTGLGGMVVTNNKKLADKVFKLKMVGVVKNRYYWHDIIGYNYRMTNICAAIGLGQLNKARNILIKKREVFKNYYFFLNVGNLALLIRISRSRKQPDQKNEN